MAAITTRVEDSIFLALPDHFELVFVGQTTPEAHLVVVFHTFVSEHAAKHRSACLAMSLLENKTTHSAEKHVMFLQFFLLILSKDVFSVVVVMADISNVNRNVIERIEVSFIGFA